MAAEAAAAAAPIRARHLADKLPTWPYGTLTRLPSLSPCPDDVLDGATVLVALRHQLTWIESRHLRRASRAHYVIKTSQHALAGDILGISSTGVIKRRRRLARAIAHRGQVKNSPQLPRIDPGPAAEAAALLLEHRAGLVPAPPPPVEDLIGAAAHAAAWPDTPDLKQLADDIRAALTVVVFLRRHFDDIEADLLDLGRSMGISNTDLGKPFGRLGSRATWKARARLRNGDRPGRHRRVRAPVVDEPVLIAEAAALDDTVASRTQTLIARLLEYRPKIDDEDLDIWMGWLADHATAPPTDHTMSLLGTVADDLCDDPHAQSIDGLVELAHEIRTFRRAQRQSLPQDSGVGTRQ